ncbi:IS3 family transposase [Salimicrobium album]
MLKTEFICYHRCENFQETKLALFDYIYWNYNSQLHETYNLV